MTSATNKDIGYSFTYDSAGRVTNVVDSRGYSLDYDYDILGTRTKTTLQKATPDEHVTTYAYDGANRPSTIASANYSGFDRVGNRKNKTTSSGTETYGYDGIYRLISTVTPKGTENYGYDAVGNRLSGPGPKDSKYQYNAGNQMTVGKLFAYAYDNNGNRSQRTAPNAQNKSWLETWDHENRLIKSEQTKGAEKRTVTFKYDPLGRRIQKQLTTIVNGVGQTSTWVYVYDNDNIALEIYTDAGGTTEKTWYTHGAGVDEHLALERNGNYFYYHADGLGSVTAITDANKSIVQSYTYDSFGKGNSSNNFRNGFTYTGREWDKETGLYYYRARHYDPMEGRFISKDPIGFDGGDVNLYGYTRNNPINLTDPTGNDPWYGNYCGPGYYSAPPKDDLDRACQQHDACYAVNGFGWKDVVKPPTDGDACNNKNKCDKELRDAAMRFTPTYDKSKRARDMVLRIF